MSLSIARNLLDEEGYWFSKSINIAQKIKRTLNEPLLSLSWGRPVYVEHLNRVLAATSEDSGQGCLVSIHPSSLAAECVASLPTVRQRFPLKQLFCHEAQSPLSHQVYHTRNLNNLKKGMMDIAFREDGIGAAASAGGVCLLSACRTGPPFFTASVDDLGYGYINELCFPSRGEVLTAGTEDGHVFQFDMETVTSIGSVQAPGEVYSVRRLCGGATFGVCIRLGAASAFALYDARAKELLDIFTIDGQLNTSATIGSSTLLGHHSGLLQVFDIRTGRVVSDIHDPFVGAIGNIELSADSERFVVSGAGDHTLYRIQHGVARPVTNSTGTRQPTINGNNISTNAVIVSNSVFSTDTQGNVSISAFA